MDHIKKETVLWKFVLYIRLENHFRRGDGFASSSLEARPANAKPAARPATLQIAGVFFLRDRLGLGVAVRSPLVRFGLLEVDRREGGKERGVG